MGIKMIAVILSAVFAATSASMVNLTSQWRADFGWEVTCSWQLFANDSLQSVRLMDHERQFLIYRPERNGVRYSQHFQFPDKLFQIECYETSEMGVTGQCLMTLELYQPVVDDMRYACEVSGERPYFRIEKQDIDIAAIAPPTDAVIEVAQRSSGSRVVLNCTSSGMPAPSLLWTVGEQRVPQDFFGKTWNVTSKLWNSWSLLSYTSDIPATCTPETSRNGQIYKGHSAEYSAAYAMRGTFLVLGVLPILALTR